MDQGIIQNFKCGYWRQWLRFLINYYINYKNPIKKTNLYNTLRWIAKAQREDVTKAIIRNCQAKLTILEKADNLKELPPPLDLIELIYKYQAVAQVSNNACELETFLYPKGKDNEPNKQVNLQEIIDFYIGKIGLKVVPKEDDAVEPLPSLLDALKALIIV